MNNAMFKELIDALEEGVLLLDANLHLILINEQFLEKLSLNRREIEGQPLSSFAPESVVRLVKEALALQKRVNALLKTKKGDFEISATYSKSVPGVIMTLREQTHAEKADELAHDFIAHASHELKTPITIVRGFAETLHDHPEISPEVRQEITGRIKGNCERMVSLVRSLLTLASVDEGISEERLHRCDPKEIVESARKTILTLHPTAEISIKQESSFMMKADKELLLQAMLNLLDNAVKYSSDPAKVEVLLRQDKEKTIISVRDHGQGMAAENLERIFEKFYAIDKTLSRSLGGYGLGLSIVRRIVEKHHGEIEVLSKEGEGSTFILRFPRK